MRRWRWLIVVAGTVLVSVPASAQTYDPSYPVCLKAYGPEGCAITCAYTSLAQCALSASGGSAQCVVNPFRAHFAPETSPRASRPRHHAER